MVHPRGFNRARRIKRQPQKSNRIHVTDPIPDDSDDSMRKRSRLTKSRPGRCRSQSRDASGISVASAKRPNFANSTERAMHRASFWKKTSLNCARHGCNFAAFAFPVDFPDSRPVKGSRFPAKESREKKPGFVTGRGRSSGGAVNARRGSLARAHTRARTRARAYASVHQQASWSRPGLLANSH